MKKKLLVFGTCFFLILALTMPVSGQKKKMELKWYGTFSVKFYSDSIFDPIIWGPGIFTMYKLTDQITLIPELGLETYDFKFSDFTIVPGVTAMYKVDKFLVGGGLIYFLHLSKGWGSDLGLKIQGIYPYKMFLFILSIDTPFKNFFGYFRFGITAAYKIK